MERWLHTNALRSPTRHMELRPADRDKRSRNDPSYQCWTLLTSITKSCCPNTSLYSTCLCEYRLFYEKLRANIYYSHLLGKKSWNVYNPENVARVRRDEAQAKAREEEEERRMQEVDAEHRIQILRGERPHTPHPPPASPLSAAQHEKRSRRDEEAGRYSKKRRRLAGEDDTDRDIRLAREEAQLADGKRAVLTRSKMSDARLEDCAGHINLFPSETARAPVEKNAEAEAEATEKKRRYEDQYTMRFSNAAGFSQSVGKIPWYSASGREAAAPDSMPEKDVWGNEDSMRQQRDMARMDANDPLAAMRKGVKQLRTVEQERKRWNDERSRELEALKAEDRERSRRHRRRPSPSRGSISENSLERFKLDASPNRQRDGRSSHRHHHRHPHQCDRSRDRSRRHHSHSYSHSRPHRHHRDHHESRHDDRRSSHRP